MAILVGSDTRLIVQGITGRDGSFHTGQMLSYGTRVVGGTRPGKGGTTVEGVPVFNTVTEAVRATKANTSIIFVPAAGGAHRHLEGAAGRPRVLVGLTGGTPLHYM